MDYLNWDFQIQKTTDLSSTQVLDRTHLFLFENGYRIIQKTDDAIKFDNGSNGLTWISRQEAYLKLNKGTFKYIADSKAIIQVAYSVSFIMELALLILISALAIGTNYWIFFGILPFVIQFVFKLNTIKNRTCKMLLQISGDLSI